MSDTRELLRLTATTKLDAALAARRVIGSGDKSQDRQETEKLANRIGELQSQMYAGQQHKVLLVLQGMDTSGKDRSVNNTFARCNLMGLRTWAFKAPSALELAHDYLWRVHAQVPARGQICVFNRSHYEDVLVPRVHGQIDAAECARRYQHICAFETLLADTGTTILKIFLHISRTEQTARLQARMRDPQKQWKFDPSDLTERPFWENYQDAYLQAMLATDAPHAPWYVIPADSKTQRNLAVASLVAETLENLGMEWPTFRPELAATELE